MPNNSNHPRPIALISVVFSFYNEDNLLSELVSRVRKVFQDLREADIVSRHELIFVNDASTDNSLSVLLDLAKNHDDIRIINMSRNFGVTPCVMAGLRYASGDAVIYMDTDLQDPPEVIPLLIKAWIAADDIDVIHTKRISREGESFLKKFITKVGYFLLNCLCVIPLPQEHGDFKLLSKKVVKYILSIKDQNPFMRGLVCWVGFKQTAVLYNRASRFAGKSKFFILSRKVISNFINSALVHFSEAPLNLIVYIGLILFFVDFLLLSNMVIDKINSKIITSANLLALLIIFLSAIQVISLGIIGIYLKAIHNQTRSRPLYIVASSFGFLHPVENNIGK